MRPVWGNRKAAHVSAGVVEAQGQAGRLAGRQRSLQVQVCLEQLRVRARRQLVRQLLVRLRSAWHPSGHAPTGQGEWQRPVQGPMCRSSDLMQAAACSTALSELITHQATSQHISDTSKESGIML